MSTKAAFPNIVSADDHIVEPPRLWQERLPARMREQGPRVVREKRPARLVYEMGAPTQTGHGGGDDDVWCDVWRFEDVEVPLDRSVAAVGFAPDEIGVFPTTYEEIRPGCYDVAARLADMDINHVEASICYPNTFVRFAGQRFLAAKDKVLGLRCVQAYNDFVIEEWANQSGGRLYPACIVPLWDVDLAVAEVERTAELGSRVITFTELPTYLDLPSLYTGYWDTLLDACERTSTVISMHIGSGSRQLTTSSDAPLSVIGILNFSSAMMSLVDWLVSGRLDRFPTLRLSFAECQIGWIPYVLQRADQFAKSGWGVTAELREFAGLPSDYFRRQVYVCFFDDVHGIASLEQIGVDNVCFETDYPHADSTYPNSRARAEELCSGLSPENTLKLMRKNALALLGAN